MASVIRGELTHLEHTVFRPEGLLDGAIHGGSHTTLAAVAHYDAGALITAFLEERDRRWSNKSAATGAGDGEQIYRRILIHHLQMEDHVKTVHYKSN